MRVVCDNCGATYKIPQAKLVKEVNKATCRKCGHRMLIRKPQDARRASSSAGGAEAFRSAAQAAASAAALSPMQHAPRSEWEEEDPTHIARLDQHGNPLPPPSVPRPGQPAAAAAQRPAPQAPATAPAPAAPRTPQPAAQQAQAAPRIPQPAAQQAQAAAPAAAPAATPTPAQPAAAQPASPQRAAAPARPRAAFDPSGDLTLASVGVVVALVGALILAVNVDGGVMQRFVGLLMALWGTLTALFVLVTGSRGRKKASTILSFFLGSFFAFGGAALIGLVTIDTDSLGSMTSLVDGLEPEAKTETPATPAAGVDERIDALFAEDEPAAASTTTDAADGSATEAGDAVDDAATDAPAAGAAAADAAAADDDVLIPVKPTTTTSTSSRSGTTSASSGSSRSSSSSGSSAQTSTSSGSTSSGSSSSASTRSSGSSSASTPSSSRSSSSTPASSTSGSSSSSSTPSSSSSGSSSAGMSTLPATVVDTMMKSNRNIKKCFYQEYKRSNGNLGTATIRFKVLPSGKVSSAYVTTSRYKGTELDSCLSSATYTVAFPSFDGDTITLEWTGGAG